MGKEWHLLLHCVRVYKQNRGIHDPPLPHQPAEASSQVQEVTPPKVSVKQKHVPPPPQASSAQPVLQPSQYLPRQPLQFMIPHTSVPQPPSSTCMAEEPFQFSSPRASVPSQHPVDQPGHPQQERSPRPKSRKQSKPKVAPIQQASKKKGSSKSSPSTKEPKK